MDVIHRYFEELPGAAGIVAPDGAILFANRAARDVLTRSGKGARMRICEPLLREVESVTTSGRARVDALIEPPGTQPVRFRGRLWPLTADMVAMLFVPESDRKTAVDRVGAALGLEAPEARLAIRVARGLTNREIARLWRVPETTVKSRLHRLFVKLGMRRRAEIAATVTRCLSENGD